MLELVEDVISPASSCLCITLVGVVRLTTCGSSRTFYLDSCKPSQGLEISISVEHKYQKSIAYERNLAAIKMSFSTYQYPTMNTALQSRLDALDTALSTLVDSITSLNPSVPAAQSLLTADDDLQKSVKLLLKHQANYTRITSLRTQIDSLNASITSNVSSLASLRSEILAQNITPIGDEGRRLECNELLEYAQRISRYTVPPTYRPQVKQAQRAKGAGEDLALPEIVPINGHGGDAAAQPEFEKAGEQNVAEVTSMGTWVPWPSEDIIRQGPLGQSQIMQEQGLDPAHASGEEVKEETVDVMDGVVNKERGEQDGEAKDRIVERETARRKEEQTEEKPKVFGGLDLYDPDEE